MSCDWISTSVQAPTQALLDPQLRGDLGIVTATSLTNRSASSRRMNVSPGSLRVGEHLLGCLRHRGRVAVAAYDEKVAAQKAALAWRREERNAE